MLPAGRAGEVAMKKWIAFLGGALILAGVASACGPALPPQTEAADWLATHLAPEPAGRVNAMILPGGLAIDGFTGAAAAQACPGLHLAAYYAPSAGGLPGCGAWTATALTATGHVVALACGSIPGRMECPMLLHQDGYIPSAGDYVQIRPGGGQVAGGADIYVVREFSDGTLLSEEPDPGGPVFVTTPAGDSR